MIDEEYFVPDTNVLISRSLTRSSPAAVAFHLALDRYQMLISDETFQELESVLLRAKFDRYSTIAERLGFWPSSKRPPGALNLFPLSWPAVTPKTTSS
jgi:hypothetical protein